MPVKPLFKGLGSVLGEIPLDSIEANPDASASLEGLTTLTSYNLMPKNKRTIIVPGSPSVWTPRDLPTRIKRDSGRHFTDPVRHVFPKCPLEPLFRALLVTDPDFNLSGVDIVTDRRNLRLLLGFVQGSRQEFRIDVEVVGSAVLFYTWTHRAVGFSQGFVGYGREFEKAWTRTPAGMAGSITHHRAVGYALGGVRVVMRYEVDGCMEGDGQQQSADGWIPTGPKRQFGKKLVTPTNYTIISRGTLTPPSRIIEIKTGPFGKNLSTSSNIAQLWFSQTPILCAGQYNADGIFTSVSVTDMALGGGLSKWEENNGEKVRILARLLEMVRVALSEKGDGRYVLLLPQGGTALKIYECNDGGAGNGKGLPADLVERWKSAGKKEQERHQSIGGWGPSGSWRKGGWENSGT
ncbi:MAG: hypothetical protein M1839_002176 [Geoglossum umbratile]|nr:MAG: hypothetical protein M1839_002176 [Geoglossum umbratile]